MMMPATAMFFCGPSCEYYYVHVSKFAKQAMAMHALATYSYIQVTYISDLATATRFCDFPLAFSPLFGAPKRCILNQSSCPSSMTAADGGAAKSVFGMSLSY